MQTVTFQFFHESVLKNDSHTQHSASISPYQGFYTKKTTTNKQQQQQTNK